MTLNDASQTFSTRQAWKALAALCVGFFMLLVDQTVVAVATPVFQTKLQATLNEAVWVTSVYLLTYAVPILFTGRLGDRYGQRDIYLVGLAVFTLSSLWCALSQSIVMLIVARAVQGIGAAIMTPQTMSVVNRVFPRDKQGAAMGLWGAVAGIATMAGPLLGGIIVSAAGWEWVFAINVPIGIVGFVLVLMWVPKLPKMARAIHVPSVVVSVLAIFFLVFGLQQGPELGWNWVIWLMLAGGIGLNILFLYLQYRAERRHTDPIIPIHIFRNRNFLVAALAVTGLGFMVGSYNLPVMLYLQEDIGLGSDKAGFMLVPMAVISFVFSPWAGTLVDKVHPAKVSFLGFGLLTLGIYANIVVMRQGWNMWWMMVPIVLIGFGNTFAWSPLGAEAMRALPAEVAGAGSGVYNMTRQVGSVLGGAVVGALMQIGVAHTHHSDAMGNSLAASAVVMTLACVGVLFFRSSKPAADVTK